MKLGWGTLSVRLIRAASANSSANISAWLQPPKTKPVVAQKGERGHIETSQTNDANQAAAINARCKRASAELVGSAWRSGGGGGGVVVVVVILRLSHARGRACDAKRLWRCRANEGPMLF